MELLDPAPTPPLLTILVASCTHTPNVSPSSVCTALTAQLTKYGHMIVEGRMTDEDEEIFWLTAGFMIVSNRTSSEDECSMEDRYSMLLPYECVLSGQRHLLKTNVMNAHDTRVQTDFVGSGVSINLHILGYCERCRDAHLPNINRDNAGPKHSREGS